MGHNFPLNDLLTKRKMSKFYLTTPLYYVNDKPHIGHAYTTILADVLARYHRIMGDDVYFLTGTDEHGQKVQEAADKRSVDPKSHVDEYVIRFQNLWKRLHISYDDFIRTTDPRHTDRVQELLNTLYERDEIYLDEYEGLYSVSEERFITEKEVEEGRGSPNGGVFLDIASRRSAEFIKLFIERFTPGAIIPPL